MTAPIGAGGMGEVYRARDTRLQRDVALKLLPPRLASDATALERFHLEARVIASVNHPHICTVYDVGEHEGGPFLVMELLEGSTLDARTGSPLRVIALDPDYALAHAGLAEAALATFEAAVR